jgi:uncharacterized membrane protein YgcG
LSNLDAYEDDMGRISNLSDRDLDRLLAGKAPLGADNLDDVVAFVGDVKVDFQVVPDEATAAKHLAAINAAAGDAATSADRERPTQRSSRSKFMGRNRKLVTAIVAGVLVLSVFGGAAYAGALPAPVQNAVSGVADDIGVSLPDSNDGDVANVDDGQVGNTDDGAVGDSDDGAVGDSDDGAVGNTDDGAVGDENQGDQNNADDGAAGDQSEGDQGNADQGQDGNQDQGGQADQDAGDQGGSGSSGSQGGGSQGGGGEQGNGNN